MSGSNWSVLNGTPASGLTDESVAYLAFIMDSQHAMMFGHALVLSPQELALKPPCKEDLWAAGSAAEWQRVRQREGDEELSAAPTFPEAIRLFVNDPLSAKDKVNLDPFGSYIVLHGIIALIWQYQQKSQLSLGRCPLKE
jgi:hypothetical protein